MNEWRRRTSSTIPYGWRLSHSDARYIEPVELEQTALMAALAYLDRGRGQRETARWLSAKTGRTISDRGLAKLWRASQRTA